MLNKFYVNEFSKDKPSVSLYFASESQLQRDPNKILLETIKEGNFSKVQMALKGGTFKLIFI